MGTWGDESGSSHETQNDSNEIVASNGAHHDDIDVEVVDGDNGQYHENEVINSEGEQALVQHLQRVGLQDNGNNDSNVEAGVKGFEVQGGGLGEEWQNHAYPIRSYASDCAFYMKTGTCKFGQNCRFNHPPVKSGFEEKAMEEINGAVDDSGKIDCKYFLTPGGCKYGDGCNYNHSASRTERQSPELNFLGLPIRPMAQECTYYLRTGSCGYGASCRFHHPDPGAAKEYESANSLANGRSVKGGINYPRNYGGQSLQSFGVPQGTSDLSDVIKLRNSLPYSPEMNSYHQSITLSPGWSQNQVSHSFPASKASLPHPIMNNISKKAGPSTHYENLMQIEEFPERPGQPDCDYFMKTGNCRYRSACRYNHPTSGASKLRLLPLSSKSFGSRPGYVLPVEPHELPSSNFNHLGRTGMTSPHHQQQIQSGEFPERPGQPECEYYMKTGQCKFKSECRYHHPKNRMSTSTPCALSEKGLPLRPGAKICRNYELQGMCKYGRNCLFHHPDNYSPAVPVAAQVHSSINVTVAADLASPAAYSCQPDWDDSWAM